MPAEVLIHRTLHAREGNGPHPGLLLLHGRGADENDLLPLASQLDPSLFVVSVRAPFGFPWGGFAWYDIEPQGTGFPESVSLQTSLDRLHALIGHILETYPIDPERLYVGGFSMGAVMSGTLALLDPNRIAGAMMLSGYLPLRSGLELKPELASGHRMFVAHGVQDPVIPVSWGRETKEYLENTSVSLEYHEYPAAHEITVQELTDAAGWLRETLGQSMSR